MEMGPQKQSLSDVTRDRLNQSLLTLKMEEVHSHKM
jgi:hypothetical protein